VARRALLLVLGADLLLFFWLSVVASGGIVSSLAGALFLVFLLAGAGCILCLTLSCCPRCRGWFTGHPMFPLMWMNLYTDRYLSCQCCGLSGYSRVSLSASSSGS